MLQVVKEDYLYKAKEALTNAVSKVLEKPETLKRNEFILKKISPILAQTFFYLENKCKKLEQEFKEYDWQWKGRMQSVKNSEKAYGRMVEHLKRVIAENKNNTKDIRSLTKNLSKMTKERDRLHNRLYERWNKLKSFLLKRNKKKIKHYVKKKKVQILKLKRKVQK